MWESINEPGKYRYDEQKRSLKAGTNRKKQVREAKRIERRAEKGTCS